MTQLTSEELLAKIEQAQLVGRGGSGYSTALKWKEMYEKHHETIYMAVNGSEGEPGTLKDGYILASYLQELLFGIHTAYTIFPQTKIIYIYLRKDYFATHKQHIYDLVKTTYPALPIEVFEEPGGYLCGENTVLVNAIEKRRLEPRKKPPYISEVGILGKPTIVNNLETFYQIGKIARDEYHDTRLYSISGTVSHPGVYEAPNTITVYDLLKQTNNEIPPTAFLILGGGASGIYLTQEELNTTPANKGTGALIVYDSSTHTFLSHLKEKLTFLIQENCGKCTPCREGVYRLHEMIVNNTWDETRAKDIAQTLAKTSFCGLGVGAGNSILSLFGKKDDIWKQ